MTTRELKGRLYSRHPGHGGQMPGPWTVIEEYRGIDLLAFGAWDSVKHARVGYEVKVSRSDYRREVLSPGKRASNVAWCNEFYFAVPAGLLTDEELGFEEPEEFQQLEAFSRGRCPDDCRRDRRRRENGHPVFFCLAPGHPDYDERRSWMNTREEWATCETCKGTGYVDRSLVERTAPTLWVPADVGLVVVDGRGAKVVRKSPKRGHAKLPVLTPREIGQMVRWISMRPDPRHHPKTAEAVAA
jgi:hypothetical protein